MIEKEIELTAPHGEKQEKLITYPGNICNFSGRRWGKTEGNVQRLYYWMSKQPGMYWWVGLSWQSASMKKAWRGTTNIARDVLSAMGLDARGYINRSRHEIIIPGLGEIWFRTSENPASLAGEGIYGAVMDEFSLMSERVWTEYLQGTLLDFDGWVSMSGVPKGNNWAANMYNQAPDKENWLQLHATTYDNPHIPRYAIENIKETTPQNIFDQEYLAKVVAGVGTVFRNIEKCMSGEEHHPAKHKKHHVVMGVDWGKQNDFTAISIGCRDCQKELAKDRFNKIDYAFQRKRLKAWADRWGVNSILPERNSMGVPIIEELVREGLPIAMGEDGEYGFYTGASNKPTMIENLALAFEKQEWQFIDDNIWNAELAAYERTISEATGRSKYSAPEGMHDDTVMARALMLQEAYRAGPSIAFA